MILIPSDICTAMVAHCVRESPLECCGVLGGRGMVARSFHPFRNSMRSETRYEADPTDVIRAVQELRSRGEEFVAIYHSHPRWQAVPSQTDLETNYYGDLPRIIVSLLGDTPEVRAWRLTAHSYEEVTWTMVDSSGGSG
jgi:proteasome lid subunit RPN8/RPN11